MISPADLKPYLERLQRKGKAEFGLREKHPRPHFLGVGTQKGGTTTLYQLLKKHPEIYLPDNKEIHFFTKHFERGEAWYREQFEASPAGQLRGEITPYYLFHAAVPERIHALRSDMKIIALLRNPVERTLSQYFHSCRWNMESLSLEDALAAEEKRLEGAIQVIEKPGGTHLSYQEHSYVARSRYEQQLSRYFDLFGRERVLVLRSEDLFAGDPMVMEKIQDWLNIKAFPKGTTIPCANEGHGEANQVSTEIRDKLEKELEPTFAWLRDTLNIHWDKL